MKKQKRFQLAEVTKMVELETRQDPYKQQLDEVSANSVTYFNKLMEKFQEAAIKGYGACVVYLDKTYDLFDVLEDDDSYSASQVRQLLRNEGFELSVVDDMYDAWLIEVLWLEDYPVFQYNRQS